MLLNFGAWLKFRFIIDNLLFWNAWFILLLLVWLFYLMGNYRLNFFFFLFSVLVNILFDLNLSLKIHFINLPL